MSLTFLARARHHSVMLKREWMLVCAWRLWASTVPPVGDDHPEFEQSKRLNVVDVGALYMCSGPKSNDRELRLELSTRSLVIAKTQRIRPSKRQINELTDPHRPEISWILTVGSVVLMNEARNEQAIQLLSLYPVPAWRALNGSSAASRESPSRVPTRLCSMPAKEATGALLKEMERKESKPAFRRVARWQPMHLGRTIIAVAQRFSEAD